MLASGATPPRRTGPPPLLRGRRALLAAAATLTLLWAGLAVGWLSDWSPREERQLRAILRAYGPGEPYSVPDFLATKVPCEDTDYGYGGIDPTRLDHSIDQIALTHTFKTKPKNGDVFDASFLPPAAERRAN